MTPTFTEKARESVEKIFYDLGDRRWLKWVFDTRMKRLCYCGQCEPISAEVQEEIKVAWSSLIASALEAEYKRGKIDGKITAFAEDACDIAARIRMLKDRRD